LEKVEHEICISELIYSLHGIDTYEDLFRDNVPGLQAKKTGIVYAIKGLEEYNSCKISSP
jgi:hypothetical protein